MIGIIGLTCGNIALMSEIIALIYENITRVLHLTT
jgi:hypothetical protein